MLFLSTTIYRFTGKGAKLLTNTGLYSLNSQHSLGRQPEVLPMNSHKMDRDKVYYFTSFICVDKWRGWIICQRVGLDCNKQLLRIMIHRKYLCLVPNTLSTRPELNPILRRVHVILRPQLILIIISDLVYSQIQAKSVKHHPCLSVFWLLKFSYSLLDQCSNT